MQKNYFALEEPKKLIAELQQFINGWENSVGYGTRGLASVWRRNSQAYYSNVVNFDDAETALSFEGEQGELIKMCVPQARSLYRQFVGLITKQKLAFKTVAQSTDAETLEGSRLGDAVAEHIVMKERLDAKYERLVEESGIVGSSFMKVSWRSDKGAPRARDPETGNIAYTGDIKIDVVSAFDVLFDYRIEEWDDLDWVLVRTRKNKWDLIAQFPHLKDAILKVPQIPQYENGDSLFFGVLNDYKDQIYVYEFYHKDTPAVSEGRITAFASKDAVFSDGPNPYGFIPVEPMIPEKVLFTGLGYPFFSNLLPLQEILDASLSVIATNQQAFGVQQVLVPDGANLTVNDLGPLKFLNYTPQNTNGGGAPQALQLTSTPQEIFKFVDVVMQQMQQISLVSSVLRGQPPQGVTAASAIATLSANSLQSLEAFSKAGTSCLERIMDKAFKIYTRFADVPQVVEIMGPRKTYIAKEFTGKDLQSISRVKMTIANPLASTAAGKREIALDYMKLGFIKKPDQYATVLETGNLEVMYDDEVNMQMTIEQENDMMREGGQAMALMTDDHARHILCHKSVLSDPMTRSNGAIVQAVLDHIQQHVDLNRTMDPDLKAMLLTGQTPAPPPPQQMPPPPGPEMAAPVDEVQGVPAQPLPVGV